MGKKKEIRLATLGGPSCLLSTAFFESQHGANLHSSKKEITVNVRISQNIERYSNYKIVMFWLILTMTVISLMN